MEEKTAKKVMLSGIQPSGDLTLGSYLGAIKNWSERAEIFDCYYFMADLHSITVRQNPADLRRLAAVLEEIADLESQTAKLDTLRTEAEELKNRLTAKQA
mgnify:CR=1 FL=1